MNGMTPIFDVRKEKDVSDHADNILLSTLWECGGFGTVASKILSQRVRHLSY